MLVICFEGCHGSGKTSLCKEVSNMGFRVLDENFLDMPAHSLHPQSLFMETKWVCAWFDRVLTLARHDRNKNQVFFADRSPFSAVFYATHGHLLDQVIRAQMKEVADFANVQFLTVHVNVEKELLWSRIQHRLQLEPERVRYAEHKRSKMEDCLAFYNSFPWDMQVHNDATSLQHFAQNVITMLLQKLPTMQLAVQAMAAEKDCSMGVEFDQTDSDCESEMTVSCYDDTPIKERLASVADVAPIRFNLDME
ncbi:hypothetical protein SDRG_02371 [Saprolegnia diclina VS20]|uniref:NadR/Ttd14 AAA domain-containing protein n=1 Tax=Saprolegnia diclina (strain VS20) TaxID=1156394 RepID=T0QQV6_SAPDV|nr:hypothetical protein SDRG_02371 [Saprolegnia diclina VS20]EQC40479.1 hypothetical protein SDRG_02371 [Saprolegnia diclina VS20]|eukprot:XP_008606178.1 hypothetical protein SDRG_02371 [Saprolegnia diclina VS20]